VHPVADFEFRPAEQLARLLGGQQAGHGPQLGVGRALERLEDAAGVGLLVGGQVHDETPGRVSGCRLKPPPE
jgi:hypothetical protein